MFIALDSGCLILRLMRSLTNYAHFIFKCTLHFQMQSFCQFITSIVEFPALSICRAIKNKLTIMILHLDLLNKKLTIWWNCRNQCFCKITIPNDLFCCLLVKCLDIAGFSHYRCFCDISHDWLFIFIYLWCINPIRFKYHPLSHTDLPKLSMS